MGDETPILGLLYSTTDYKKTYRFESQRLIMKEFPICPYREYLNLPNNSISDSINGAL
jgi:hypothetical protein